MIRKLALLGIAAFAGKKLLDHKAGASAGHAPTDLGADLQRDNHARADPHFRPDPHGHVPPEDLEGLRPVTFKPADQPVGYAS